MDSQQMIEKLKTAGVSFEPGMSARELDRAETVFHFRFPKEIREFLAVGVPVGDAFFNYRDCSDVNLTRFHEFQASIERSFRFDLANNRDDMLEYLGKQLGFHEDSDSFDDAVMKYLHDSVRLIPFYAHRCFFDGMDNMPIVSFWQPVDTVIYGDTFEYYLETEFLNKQRYIDNLEELMKDTGIWRDLICID